jgi:glycosyltransferase involved in cell wall biosynthesis
VSRFDRRATERLLKEADLLLAKSATLQRNIARYGDYAEKTEVVRWGIDTARFARDRIRGEALRRKLDLPEGPLLLSPRILRPLYNIHLIIEAMPEILVRCPEAFLVVSRHGEDLAYGDRLRQRVAALGLTGSVRFIDPVDHDGMPDLLSITNVVVSVPFSDGLPQTLFESLASETPIVLGRLAAYGEIVQHEREVLLTDLNAPAIASAASRLLLDHELAFRLRAAGLKRIREQASLPEEARRVAGFYRRVLTDPCRNSPLGPRLLDAISLAFRRGQS